MHVVVFGLTVSSAWGNGHATLWRSLLSAMLGRGYQVTFYEKDVPYYANHRDLTELPAGGRLRLYSDFEEIRAEAELELAQADLALCTSFCPDGRQASELILASAASVRSFYDLDTPVTLASLESGLPPAYLPEEGLRDFDVVLSYTGGRALDLLKSRLGARQVATLYGWVDPASHFPVAPQEDLRCALSYLGTYAEDRQRALQTLLLDPAERLPGHWFLIGGAQYPETFPWKKNVGFMRHVPPALHPAFFSSGRATLNVTRSTMGRYGYCPSGRLFEAAACAAPILSDWFEGLDTFFVPGEEILLVETADDVVRALGLSDSELKRVGEAARERVLGEATAHHRVLELEKICQDVRAGRLIPV